MSDTRYRSKRRISQLRNFKRFHDCYNPKNEANDLVFLCHKVSKKAVSPGNPGFF
jgi:hypothetical protein